MNQIFFLSVLKRRFSPIISKIEECSIEIRRFTNKSIYIIFYPFSQGKEHKMQPERFKLNLGRNIMIVNNDEHGKGYGGEGSTTLLWRFSK